MATANSTDRVDGRSLKRRDYTGHRFRMLVAIRWLRQEKGKAVWLFRCDCGKEREIRANRVVSGDKVSSCGCMIVEVASGRMASRDGRIRQVVDLSGWKAGRFTVLREAPKKPGRRMRRWLCLCECGKEFISSHNSLTSRRTSSCGCLQREKAVLQAIKIGAANATHRMTKSPEWKTWEGMRARCSNPKYKNYPHYGGRGITVCERWSEFKNFYADMGNRPSDKHSLGRINNDGPYCPDNCRWETQIKQQRNKTNSRRITHNGVTKLLCEWAEDAGLTTSTLWRRLKSGMSLEKAISMPLRKRQRKA